MYFIMLPMLHSGRQRVLWCMEMIQLGWEWGGWKYSPFQRYRRVYICSEWTRHRYHRIYQRAVHGSLEEKNQHFPPFSGRYSTSASSCQHSLILAEAESVLSHPGSLKYAIRAITKESRGAVQMYFPRKWFAKRQQTHFGGVQFYHFRSVKTLWLTRIFWNSKFIQKTMHESHTLVFLSQVLNDSQLKNVARPRRTRWLFCGDLSPRGFNSSCQLSESVLHVVSCAANGERKGGLVRRRHRNPRTGCSLVTAVSLR